jgi:hypothetical protein
MNQKRIGIKYCGGCNPTYERVATLKTLEQTLGKRFLFVRHDDKDLDALLYINGCPKACADDAEGLGLPQTSITSEKDFHRIIQWLEGV